MEKKSLIKSFVEEALKNNSNPDKKPTKKKKSGKKEEFVKWFSELNKDSGKTAGGKGANLAEIYNLGVQVPPGFVIQHKLIITS